MIKRLLCLLAMLWHITSLAAVSCSSDNLQCTLLLTNAGSLVDRTTGKVLAKDIANQGMLADVSILKFSDNYVLVRESFTDDKPTLFAPLKKERNS